MADDVLAGVPLFEEMSVAERMMIAEKMRIVDIPPEVSLIEEGDLSYKFFVILAGTVEVSRDGSPLARLGPGEFVGEHGILSHERRGADVVALTPVRAAVAIGWDVRDLMEEQPSVGHRIMQADAERSDAAAL